MAFITLPSFKGKLYMPAHDPAHPRKHACENCFSCQMCSDDRCELCLKTEGFCLKINKSDTSKKILIHENRANENEST